MAKNNFTAWQPLKVGDTVDIIAPGFSISDEQLKAAVDFVKNLGLKPRVPDDIFGPDVICSQTDAIRLKHLKNAFTAKDSKAIWCLRGGYGAIRIIEDFAKLKKPKINKLFIGYSDATTIHNFLNQFWHFSTLHGPLLDRLGKHTLSLEQVNEMVDVVFGNRTNIEHKNLKPLNAAARKKLKILAPVVGGNLAVTVTHLGTKFARPPKGQILFFEDIGERGYRVDRMLQQLSMAGYFRGVKAILLGEFIGCEESSGESYVPRVLERFASTQKIPVLSGIEAGHGSLQRPLPLLTKSELFCGAEPILKMSSGAKIK
jgi:muramoyltetrapeptide carboxypeptidase